MQLATTLRSKIGLDSTLFTRTQVMEIQTKAIFEAIGNGLHRDVSNIVANLPDITGLQLVKTVTCDIGSTAAVTVRIEVLFDWEDYRLTVSKDGERVAMVTIPSTMTFPAIVAQAEALERLITGVCARIDTSEVNWTYDFDPMAVEQRGEAWIKERLGTIEKTTKRQARFDTFQAGRTVSQTLNDSPHQTLVVSVSKEF